MYGYCRDEPLNQVDPSGLIQVGVNIGLGGTLFLAAPFFGVGGGISASYVIGAYAYWDNGFGCEICDTASLSVLYPGVGIGATFGTVIGFVAGAGKPSDGFTVSVGVAAGLVAPPNIGAEVAIDYDINNGVLSVSVGRWGGLGLALYGTFRITGSCTGCDLNGKVREAEVLACMRTVANNIINALKGLNGRRIPPNGLAYSIAPKLPDASVDKGSM